MKKQKIAICDQDVEYTRQLVLQRKKKTALR